MKGLIIGVGVCLCGLTAMLAAGSAPGAPLARMPLARIAATPTVIFARLVIASSTHSSS